MNLAKALAAPRRLALLQKANPSQALGGIIIPNEGSHSQIINTGTDPDQLALKGWKANVWAYICVDRLASMVSQVTWRVEKRKGPKDTDWEPDPSDWRQALLNYPMGRTMPAQEVFYHFAAWLAIKGNGLLRATPGGPNGIVELVPMSPKNITPVPSKADWCGGYNFMEDGKIIWNFPTSEIIHARLPDPMDPLWGWGMLETAFPYIESDTASAKLRRDNYANGGVPPAAIVDEDLTDPKQAAEQAAAMQLAFRRNAKNRVPMLMGGKKTLIEFGFSPADMEIPSDRELTRDEIVTAHGMLVTMFSNESATYDNQDGAIRFMYENGGGRLITATEEALNGFLLTEDERQNDSAYIRPDMSRIPFFRRQREAKIDKMGAALGSGIARNDLVSLYDLGLEDAEGGDAPFVNSGLVLLSESATGIATPDAAAFNATPAEQPAPVDIAAPASQDVQVTQDAVLNGAQITAATAIVAAVAIGDMPRDAGIGQLVVLFNLESSQAEAMMGSAGKGFVPSSAAVQSAPQKPNEAPPPA